MHYKNLVWLMISFGIILLDQLSKYYAIHYLTLSQAVPIIPHFFNFFLAHNAGASFSFLADMNGWQRWFLSLTSVLITAGLLKWLLFLPKHQYLFAFALSLVIGGAIGNLIDRLQLAYVIDFIQVYYKNHYFPTFNIADSAVVMGVLLIAYRTFFRKNTL